MSLIQVRREGRIAFVSLERPEKMNALSTRMLEDLAAAVREHDGPPAERVLVFGGRGRSGFCAGSDLADVQAGEAALARHEEALSALIGALSAARALKVAVLHGQVRGGGTLFPSLADVVIAGDDLKLSLPEIHFGMYPAMLHALLLEKLPGPIAWQLSATGRVLGARESLDLGLVSEVLPVEEFESQARERVRFYAERGGALALGREMRRVRPELPVAERAAAAVPLMMRNHALPGVADRIRQYADALAARGGRVVSTEGGA